MTFLLKWGRKCKEEFIRSVTGILGRCDHGECICMTDVCMLRSNVGDFLQGVVCREAVGEGCSDFGIFTCSLFIVEHRELVACYHLTHDLCNRLPREGEVRNKERNRKRRGGNVCVLLSASHSPLSVMVTKRATPPDEPSRDMARDSAKKIPNEQQAGDKG